ncbi:uncharacterized protein LOC118436698 [Folsomia candida]|nr:uncharacterized protein LOC118436698 [Folsomia candida]
MMYGDEEERYNPYCNLSCCFLTVWTCMADGVDRVPKVKSMDKLLPETTWIVTVEENNRDIPITIRLQQPVRIPAGKFVVIKFQLDGPPTEYLFSNEVHRTMIAEPESGIVFHTLMGSAQIKELKFSVADETWVEQEQQQEPKKKKMNWFQRLMEYICIIILALFVECICGDA